jgi:hypothetical protein
MSHAVTIRLKADQMERLRQMAHRLGRTPAQASAMFVEEALRRAEFAHIDFRNSAAGRQAYVPGTGLAVWEVVWLARHYQLDVGETARHLQCPAYRVQAGLDYAAAFPEEIEPVLQEQAALDFAALSQRLPQATCFVAGAEMEAEPVAVASDGQS